MTEALMNHNKAKAWKPRELEVLKHYHRRLFGWHNMVYLALGMRRTEAAIYIQASKMRKRGEL